MITPGFASFPTVLKARELKRGLKNPRHKTTYPLQNVWGNWWLLVISNKEFLMLKSMAQLVTGAGLGSSCSLKMLKTEFHFTRSIEWLARADQIWLIFFHGGRKVASHRSDSKVKIWYHFTIVLYVNVRPGDIITLSTQERRPVFRRVLKAVWFGFWPSLPHIH